MTSLDHPAPRIALPALAAFAAFAFMLIVPFALNDGDTGWHLATGRWIAAHVRVPTTDPFSFTAQGRPWVAHEWLADLAMYAAWRAAGWSGLIILVGVALAALFAIVARELTRWLSPRATLAALLLLATGLLPSMLARPHLLALPVLALWTVTLLRAREADRAPPLAAAALMLLWANMHGSFVFGLALAAVFAFEALLTVTDRRRTILHWGAFGLASGIAALLTPAGVHGLLFPFYVNGLALLPYLNEWQPADFTSFSGFELILLVTLFALLVRPTRIPPIRLLLLLYMLHLSLQHTRQEIILVTVGALLLAEPLGRAWNRTPQPAGSWREARPILAILAVLTLALATYRLFDPVVRRDSPGVPATALAHLPPALRAQPVFNEYSFGGSLILAGIRPYIDGRSDMYGDAFTIDYFRIAKGDAARFRSADARWRFGWTILPPKNSINRLLDADPAWRRAYADDTAVIHVRAAFPDR